MERIVADETIDKVCLFAMNHINIRQIAEVGVLERNRQL